MTEVITFAGTCISKLSFDACIMTEEGKGNHKTFSYDKDGMKTFLQWLPAGSYCVMEATGIYHLRLVMHLHESGIAVSVVSPLVIKSFPQMRLIRAKTDKSDARMMPLTAKQSSPHYGSLRRLTRSNCSRWMSCYNSCRNSTLPFFASRKLCRQAA